MGKAITHIEQNLPSGLKLDDCVKDKQIYMIDLSFMANIEAAQQMPGPLCLFHVANNGDLMPVAIQLTPDKDAPVSGDSRLTVAIRFQRSCVLTIKLFPNCDNGISKGKNIYPVNMDTRVVESLWMPQNQCSVCL